jgi:hypothetical protein
MIIGPVGPMIIRGCVDAGILTWGREPGRRARWYAGFHAAAVIFDMDGILVPSEPINQRSAAAVLARRGATLTEEEYGASRASRAK